MTNATETKVVMVKVVAPIVFDQRNSDYGTTIVEIGGLNYNVTIQMKYLGEGKYAEHVSVTGLDVEMLKKFGTTFDYSEVLTAYTTQKKAAAEAREAAAKAKRLAVWESNEEVAKQIGMIIHGSKEDYLKGQWHGISFRHSETYKEQEIDITLSQRHSGMWEMTNNIFGYSDSGRDKKFKKFEKASEVLATMIESCKKRIDSKRAAAEAEKAEANTLQNLLPGTAIETMKDYHSGYRGRNGYTTEHYQIKAVAKKGESDWNINNVVFDFDPSKTTFNIRSLKADLTLEQMKQILAIVNA